MSNPKKSKAFIITFILVLILLLVAYWLFSKKDSVFKTNGVNFGKIFEPLVVSPGQTKLEVIRDRILLEKNPNDFDPNNNPNNFPVVTITNDPTSVQKGGSSTISWNSKNATSCKTSEGTLVGTSGSISTGALNDSKSFSISCTGANGTTSASTKITAGSSFGNLFKFPIVNISASPSFVEKGMTSTISWNSNNTDSCFTGDGNPTTTSGSFNTGAINKPRSYSIVCTGKYGTSSGNTFVGINNYSGYDQNQCDNGADNPILCTTLNGKCLNGAINPDMCDDFTSTNNPSLSECGDGIDNDKKEGTDSEDPSCHTDFNSKNASSYDKKIADESRIKTNTECGDGLNNDNQEGTDYLDKDCHTDGIVNNDGSYDKYINSEKGGLPTPDNNDKFCSENRITKELSPGSTTNDKTQVLSLQRILSKLNSPSLKQTYLKTTDVNGLFPFDRRIGSTQFAVATFQKDNDLNANKRMGKVDSETMKALNNKCDEFFGKPKVCSNPKAKNYPDCNKDISGKCLNGSTNANCMEILEKNYCAVLYEHPLQFNDEEKAKLDELLRKFYLIAPTLKTEDDLALVYNELNRYKTFIEQLDSLTGQCYLQTNNRNDYTEYCLRNLDSCEWNVPDISKISAGNRASYLKTTNIDGSSKFYPYVKPTIFGNPWFKQNDRFKYNGKTEYYSSVYPSLFKFSEPARRAQLLLEEGTEAGRSIIINEKDFEQMLNIW